MSGLRSALEVACAIHEETYFITIRHLFHNTNSIDIAFPHLAVANLRPKQLTVDSHPRQTERDELGTLLH